MIKNVPFGSFRGRKIEVDFSGGQITSNAGILLLKKASEKTGILEEVASPDISPIISYRDFLIL